MSQKDVRRGRTGHRGPAINAHHHFLGREKRVSDIRRDSGTVTNWMPLKSLSDGVSCQSWQAKAPGFRGSHTRIKIVSGVQQNLHTIEFIKLARPFRLRFRYYPSSIFKVRNSQTT